MPTTKVNGIKLYYEVTGEGFPLVLIHEFAGDHLSWELQVLFFSQRYQVITYNQRGFQPSEVPQEASAYSQDILVEDLYQFLRYLKIKETYIAGCSMGGNVALNFSIAHPDMTKALITIATGAGTANRKAFVSRLEQLANQIETEGWKIIAERYGYEANRIQLLRKDPSGWRQFVHNLGTHSDIGSAHIIREVIIKRPPMSSLETELKQLKLPTLIMVGDEDDVCIPPSLIMRQYLSGAGLIVFPQTGHLINLEEPDAFNRALLDFLGAVEEGKWIIY